LLQYAEKVRPGIATSAAATGRDQEVSDSEERTIPGAA
jgi:hypothetical protein